MGEMCLIKTVSSEEVFCEQEPDVLVLVSDLLMDS